MSMKHWALTFYRIDNPFIHCICRFQCASSSKWIIFAICKQWFSALEVSSQIWLSNWISYMYISHCHLKRTRNECSWNWAWYSANHRDDKEKPSEICFYLLLKYINEIVELVSESFKMISDFELISAMFCQFSFNFFGMPSTFIMWLHRSPNRTPTFNRPN